MVVDDQDADRHSGTSATIVVPGAWARLDLQLAAQQRQPLAHAEQTESLAFAVRGEAATVVLDHGSDRSAAAGEDDADRTGLGVLDDVRQRLLHDPIESRLDVARQPAVELRLEVDAHSRLLGEGVAQPLQRGDEAEVVERLRAQLDRQAAHVVQRLDDLLAHGGDGFGALLLGRGLLDRLQPEQHRGQLLPGLVVQLARQPAPLELLRLDDAAQRVAGDTRGLVDGDGGARGEGLGEAQVVIGEARVGALLVVGDDDADRSPAGDQRDVEPAARAEPAGRVLVDLGIVEERVDPLRPAPLEHAAALRPCSLELHADDLAGALRRRRPRPAASRRAAGRAIVTSRAPISPRRRRAISSSRRGELDLARERRPDLVQRLELLRPRRRRFVEPRVLDRHRRLARERPDELLVLVGERSRRPSRSDRGCRRPGRGAGSAHRGSRASADGWAGSRPSADRR